MLIDIFSTFDPNLNYFRTVSPLTLWILPTTALLLINTSLWITPNWTLWLSTPLLSLISEQTHRTYGIHNKGFNTILCAIFILLITFNLTGLIPYVFSASRHLIFSLSYGLPLWLILIISAILKAPKSTLALLLPIRTPNWLSPALILIETVRILVRPITLSFRLAANITAGHIILRLIGASLSSCIFSSYLSSSLIIILQTGYTIFELGICLIQAYIFCLLLSLYSDDHPSK